MDTRAGKCSKEYVGKLFKIPSLKPQSQLNTAT
jgi:hypothetical protein